MKDKTTEEYLVVHPMFDVHEDKLDGKHLGLMTLTKPTRVSLMMIRTYIGIMTILLAYHLLTLVH